MIIPLLKLIATYANQLLTILGLVATVIFAVYYGQRHVTAKKVLPSPSWTEVASMAEDLGKRIAKRYHPQVIVSCSMRGALICFFLERGMKRSVPMIIGDCQWKDRGAKPRGQVPGYAKADTPKWTWYIPLCVKDICPERILIVDDFAMSGRSLDAIEGAIRELCPNAVIKTATLFVSDALVQGKKTPTFYGRVSESATITFPWGTGR